MLFIFISLLFIVWISVIYLSLDKKEEKKDDNLVIFDYENTEIAQEFKNLNIKHEKFANVYNKAKEYIVWSDNLLKSIIIWILADDWHILVEWFPWLAKTKTILVYSKLLNLDFKRVQFTPDMLPSDIIWGEIYDRKVSDFKTFLWPVFTNLLLADEINRATPKVQSALLEAMQEKKVTIWWNTYELNSPFFVMATQNPIENEWTFPLPEAQVDRFLIKVLVKYPNKDIELSIIDNYSKNIESIKPLLSKDELLLSQKQVNEIFVSDEVKEYIVWIIDNLRKKDDYILLWPSPRASISLLKVAKIVAYLQNKNFVDKKDVIYWILPVLRHRIKLSMKASIENKSIDCIIVKKVLHYK